MLDPADPETFYNLAVQLYDSGDLVEAAMEAKEALRLHPPHVEAAQLLAECDAGSGEISFEAGKNSVKPTAESIRTGPDNQPPSVLHLGVAWTRVGYGVFVLCVLCSTLMVIHNPFPNAHLRHDTLSMIAVFLWPFSGLASLFWMIADIIDRRERFIWLLPVWICCLVALPALPLALYLFWGRNAMVFRQA